VHGCLDLEAAPHHNALDGRVEQYGAYGILQRVHILVCVSGRMRPTELLGRCEEENGEEATGRTRTL